MPKKYTVGKLQWLILKSVQSHGGQIQQEKQFWITADHEDISPVVHRPDQPNGSRNHVAVKRAASGLISGGFLCLASDDSHLVHITPLGISALERSNHEPTG